MLSEFPHFSVLQPCHKEEIENITSHFDPYSDFNFNSLRSWGVGGEARVALLNGNLVVRTPDYTTYQPIYSFIGESSVAQTVRILLSLTNELKLIPEVVAKKICNNEHFTVIEDVDNFDYIYEAEDIATLAGGAFKKKRNKINQLTRDLGADLTVMNISEITADIKKEILDVFDAWICSEVLSKHSGLERRALEELCNSNSSNFSVTLIRLNGKYVAFSINELLGNEYAICHFEKALRVHENIYTFLANQAAIEILHRGAAKLNWEQDLGITGLRLSKSSYRPSGFLKKYSVSLRS